jgi:hypothetical protein
MHGCSVGIDSGNVEDPVRNVDLNDSRIYAEW